MEEKRGTYNLIKHASNLDIPEKHFAEHEDILTFTNFSSCIGVVVIRENGKMWGAHLVQTNTENQDNFINVNKTDYSHILEQVPDDAKDRSGILFGYLEWGWPQTLGWDEFVKKLKSKAKFLKDVKVDIEGAKFIARKTQDGSINLTYELNEPKTH